VRKFVYFYSAFLACIFYSEALSATAVMYTVPHPSFVHNCNIILVYWKNSIKTFRYTVGAMGRARVHAEGRVLAEGRGARAKGSTCNPFLAQNESGRQRYRGGSGPRPIPDLPLGVEGHRRHNPSLSHRPRYRPQAGRREACECPIHDRLPLEGEGHHTCNLFFLSPQQRHRQCHQRRPRAWAGRKEYPVRGSPPGEEAST
jgi:hypothetical protein